MAESILQGVTTSTPFLSCNRAQTPLFSVNPGVPIDDALSMASCLLDVALCALDGINERSPVGAAFHMVEMAKAAIDAVGDGEPANKPSANAAEESQWRGVIKRMAHLFDEGVFIVNPDAAELAAEDAERFMAWVNAQRIGGGGMTDTAIPLALKAGQKRRPDVD